MRRILICAFALICTAALIGCGVQNRQEAEDTEIVAENDWVDMVQINGEAYAAAYINENLNHTEVSEEDIGESLGTVQFTMNGAVSDPGYEMHDWDATYLDEGTQVYTVVGDNDSVAVSADGTYYLYRKI